MRYILDIMQVVKFIEKCRLFLLNVLVLMPFKLKFVQNF